MSSESPAAAHPSAATASGSGPAVRPFCRRPTPAPPSQPQPRQWADPVSDTEKQLYGALISDVLFLRRRGFGVHCEGERFRVGNRLLDAEGLRAVAARERRLVGAS
jgi:hypothetical protein